MPLSVYVRVVFNFLNLYYSYYNYCLHWIYIELLTLFVAKDVFLLLRLWTVYISEFTTSSFHLLMNFISRSRLIKYSGFVNLQNNSFGGVVGSFIMLKYKMQTSRAGVIGILPIHDFCFYRPWNRIQNFSISIASNV